MNSLFVSKNDDTFLDSEDDPDRLDINIFYKYFEGIGKDSSYVRDAFDCELDTFSVGQDILNVAPHLAMQVSIRIDMTKTPPELNFLRKRVAMNTTFDETTVLSMSVNLPSYTFN